MFVVFTSSPLICFFAEEKVMYLDPEQEKDKSLFVDKDVLLLILQSLV